ncbi:MAG: FkbM family methyltransferase [Myxococcota bacterium]
MKIPKVLTNLPEYLRPLGVLARGGVTEVSGIRVALSPRFSYKLMRRVCQGGYEDDDVLKVRATLEPEDVVLELGAGLGVVASACAQIVGSERVFCFEANPALERDIRRTFELNGVEPSLEMAAVGPRAGEVELWIGKHFWSSSLVEREKLDETVRVPQRALRDVLEAHDPSYLMVDIEGGEYELFRGADLRNVRKLAIEMHPHVIGSEKVDEAMGWLQDAGFEEIPEYTRGRGLFLARKSR